MTPAEVVKLAKENGARFVDLKFIDLPGRWQHFSIPVSELNEDIFEEGLGFDGSSIEGWKAIHNSDMLVIPDPTTAKIDPFIKVATVSLICDVVEPDTLSPIEALTLVYRLKSLLPEPGSGESEPQA